MNRMQFFEQVTRVADRYDEDNAWFGFRRGGPKWSQGTWIQFIIAAWKLYEKASTSQLQMVLLGDTKIRSDSELLRNFGLVANTQSPQEAADLEMVERLMAERVRIAEASVEPAIPVMGPGSILSAERWSPLLNDALMLGGIIGGQEFHFALNEDERAVWAELASGAPGPAAASPKAQWLAFFRRVPRVFWENGTPRVFVREILGLKFFGYVPVFTSFELGFRPTGQGKQPSFAAYLDGLHTVGFHVPNREAIMASVSSFLFNDAEALASIGA
jgi:hypothetical protein